VLREFVAYGRANLVIALAVMAIGGGETSFQVISGVSGGYRVTFVPFGGERPVPRQRMEFVFVPRPTTGRGNLNLCLI